MSGLAELQARQIIQRMHRVRNEVEEFATHARTLRLSSPSIDGLVLLQEADNLLRGPKASRDEFANADAQVASVSRKLCVLSVSLRKKVGGPISGRNCPGFGVPKCARPGAGGRSPLWRRQRDVVSGSRPRARLPLRAGPDVGRSAGRGPIQPSSLTQDLPLECGEDGQQTRHRSTRGRSQVQCLGQRHEAHTEMLQFLKCCQQVCDRPAPAVQ